jgi:hypothetical protein
MLIPLLVESLVAVLLAVTIGYCVLLDRRLRAFRNDEEAMRKVVADLKAATGKAEAAISGLKLTVADGDRLLGERMKASEIAARRIEAETERAEDLLELLTRLAADQRAQIEAERQARIAAEEALRAHEAQRRDLARLTPAASLAAEDGDRLGKAAAAARALALKARERQMQDAA